MQLGKENYKEIKGIIIEYIKNKVGNKKVVIGLSGGIDSSIVCALAAEALSNGLIKVLIIKNSRYSKQDLKKSRLFAEINKLEIQEISTNDIRKILIKKLNIDGNDIIKTSTLDARICDLLIREVAMLENRIYLGTINGTERLTGWYPKGALVGDFAPIGGLLKTQEKELAKNMNLGYLIDTISETADKICSGCGSLSEFKNIEYETLDKILYKYETSLSFDLRRYKDLRIDKKIIREVINRLEGQKHKKDVFPDYPKIIKKYDK